MLWTDTAWCPTLSEFGHEQTVELRASVADHSELGAMVFPHMVPVKLRGLLRCHCGNGGHNVHHLGQATHKDQDAVMTRLGSGQGGMKSMLTLSQGPAGVGSGMRRPGGFLFADLCT